MLRVEDCKPGVEIIAVKNSDTGSRKPLLSIGMIYTIERYSPTVTNSATKKQRFKHCITLNEVDKNGTQAGWAYFLEQFKLRDKEELNKLFQIDNIPNYLRQEVLEDAI